MDFSCLVKDSGRLDAVVSRTVAGLSRSSLAGATNITVNGVRAKLSTKVFLGDKIAFSLESKIPNKILPVKMALDIIYEDRDLLVINKEAGVPTHPSAGHYDDTLVNGVLDYLGRDAIRLPDNPSEKTLLEFARPGVVHRLDLPTSGAIIIAKNDATEVFLKKQFKARLVEKEYLALTVGRLDKEGVITYALGRDERSRQKFAAYKNGFKIENGTEQKNKPLTCDIRLKAAETDWKIIEEKENFHYIRVWIKTGRTHQIRVHLASIGSPLAGDLIYNPRPGPFPRLMLHCHKIVIRVPSGEVKTFLAPLQADFIAGLEVVGLDAAAGIE